LIYYVVQHLNYFNKVKIDYYSNYHLLVTTGNHCWKMLQSCS
jgi:hypothetical protein